MSRIDEIRAREKAATKGPWHIGAGGAAHMVYAPIQGGLVCSVKRRDQPNAMFIAHSRSDIPYLLERLEAAERALREIQTREHYIHPGLLESSPYDDEVDYCRIVADRYFKKQQ
jgi:hypothetical protein